jgi:hypothetical protein
MVKKEPTYTTSFANSFLERIDFSDTLATTNHQNSLEEIVGLIFNTFPSWVEFLFKLRNKLVGIIGLKTTMPKDYNTDYKVGGYIGFFKIYEIQDNLIILGADDNHLNFRAAIFLVDTPTYNVKLTTLVKYNKRLGRIYMGLIKPFQVWVVKAMVKQAYKKSEL